MNLGKRRGSKKRVSPVKKRTVVIDGRMTSVTAEDAFWDALKEIAELRQTSVDKLVTSIDAERGHGNLSSALRLFVLTYYRGATDRPFANGGEHETQKRRQQRQTASRRS